MEIHDLLIEDQIIFLSDDNRDDIINKLIEVADKKNLTSDINQFRQAIFDREKIMSTGIGLGIAIPHAKLDVVKEFFIIIAVLKNPVDWDSLDQNPVNTVFMIGGPDNRQKDYLKILAKISLLVKNKDRRAKLKQATTTKQVIELFKSF